MVYWTSHFCHNCQNETQPTVVDLKDDENFKINDAARRVFLRVRSLDTLFPNLDIMKTNSSSLDMFR